MDIECKECKKALGNIVTGSKLHKKIVFLCTECYDKYTVYKSLIDVKFGTDIKAEGSTSMPPGFEDIFKGMKK